MTCWVYNCSCKIPTKEKYLIIIILSSCVSYICVRFYMWKAKQIAMVSSAFRHVIPQVFVHSFRAFCFTMDDGRFVRCGHDGFKSVLQDIKFLVSKIKVSKMLIILRCIILLKFHSCLSCFRLVLISFQLKLHLLKNITLCSYSLNWTLNRLYSLKVNIFPTLHDRHPATTICATQLQLVIFTKEIN